MLYRLIFFLFLYFTAIFHSFLGLANPFHSRAIFQIPHSKKYTSFIHIFYHLLFRLVFFQLFR